MRGLSRRMAVGLLGLVAVTIAAATLLGPDTPSTDTLGPAGSALSTSDTDDLGAESAHRPVLSLGDLDPPAAAHPAPFEACAVLGSDDLPVEARPAEDPVRIPQPAEGGSGCRLDYRAGPDSTVTMTITITWTAGSGSLDPQTQPGARSASFGGRAGLQRSATGPGNEQVCLGLMPAGSGTAAVRVSDTRFFTVDSCAITAAVLAVIAHKTP